MIARLAYEDEIIRKYSNLPSDRVTYYSGHIMEWKNTNWCIDPYTPEYYIPEMNGLKTGSVSKDYYCFLGSVEIEGQSFIFGFFGEKKMTDRFLDFQNSRAMAENLHRQIGQRPLLFRFKQTGSARFP